MAIHRSTFERLNILEAWRGAVSDDFAVTRAAERASMRIVFVPECLVPSYGECTWRELLGQLPDRRPRHLTASEKVSCEFPFWNRKS